MVIIKHEDGWSCSNDANINNTPKVDVKTRTFKDSLSLEVRSLYTVSGKFEGNVKIAIRDSQTNELKCYEGSVVSSSKVNIANEIDSDWLKKI